MTTSLLVCFIVVMAIVTLVQLMKLSELSAKFSRKEGDEEILQSDNRMNANILKIWAVVFLGGFTYLLIKYGITLPRAASAHGADVDVLMNVNMIMIFIVFYLIHFFLFYFTIKYYYKPGRKAVFFPHDNKLELIWTIIPSIVLMGIILFGLMTWFEMTGKPAGEFDTVEITAEQFNWTVRYPGKDMVLGASNYNLIGTENKEGVNNTLGIVTPYVIEEKIKEIDKKIAENNETLATQIDYLSEGNEEFIRDENYRLKRQKQRILDLDTYKVRGKDAFTAGADDIIKKELHLVVGKEVQMIFKSKDVIHSAFMPHFRAQMNCVPGGPNMFKMTPTITTKEMRETEGEDFDYLLLCNKICGASHYNMQIPIIVETQVEYDRWMKDQKTYLSDAASLGNAQDNLSLNTIEE